MGAFTYPRSEPGSAGHLDLVERLNATPPALRRELQGLTEETLTHRPGEGEWSIKEICGHLRDAAAILHERLSKMIRLEEPYLEPYDPDALMAERNPQADSIDSILEEFARVRGETVELLSELVHWNWARQGRHGERGRLSIRQLVDHAIAHDEQHLARVREIKRQHTQ